MSPVVLLHSAISSTSLDESDTLVQVRAVSDALRALGYQPYAIPFSYIHEEIQRQLNELSPQFVVNLVESVQGSSKDIFLAPLLLEQLQIPFAGCSSSALYLTTDKILSKRLLISSNLRTAPWFSSKDSWGKFNAHAKYLIKPRLEDASIGISQDGVVQCHSQKELIQQVSLTEKRLSLPCIAEELLTGFEYNISLIGSASSPTVLPIAVIHYENYFADRHAILEYTAKWDESSPAYQQSLPKFLPIPSPLNNSLKHIALECWKLFDLSGFARVDVRLSADGVPHILEINANPGISPGAGFVLACEQSGLTYVQMIEKIIEAIR